MILFFWSIRLSSWRSMHAKVVHPYLSGPHSTLYNRFFPMRQVEPWTFRISPLIFPAVPPSSTSRPKCFSRCPANAASRYAKLRQLFNSIVQ
ncbi:uncharacterized protein GGS22DRAFT_148109 [Annulohypoxylon maeteangense]|uniref:uncharacterized protein n=1 Tax=Annulohypoxylon maeteangense TaxID=1927788 RepID=UPI0020088389|nr:uncharacterized protein GGS22DRAFT_148109 [Annulohypoxylon maeteangense]KAI0884911.1 hypothetical protein GGS22DRAFT_148109 [Annulohypoxylon maeteangense]